MQEIQNQDNNTSLPAFDESAKATILATAKIAGIAAILSIAGAVLGLVVYFVNPDVGKLPGSDNESAILLPSGNNLFNAIFTLVMAVVLFIFLNRFSVLTKKGIESANEHQLEEGFSSLATYFKIIVILFISIIALSLVVYTVMLSAEAKV